MDRPGTDRQQRQMAGEMPEAHPIRAPRERLQHLAF
jgi:hypothetical protein